MVGQDWPLDDLLHACDAICTLTSTVGLEGHLIGKPVVQVGGSMFEDAAPFAAMGVAVHASEASLHAVLDRLGPAAPADSAVVAPAADRVVDVLRSALLTAKQHPPFI